MFKLRVMSHSSTKKWQLQLQLLMFGLIFLLPFLVKPANAQTVPQLNQFDAPAQIYFDQDLTLRWDVSGVQEVELEINAIYMDRLETMPAVGELFFEAGQFSQPPFGNPSDPTFRLYAEGQLLAEKKVEIGCTYEYFFKELGSGFTGICPQEPFVSRASHQKFERGFMLWIEESDEIHVYVDAHLENTVQAYLDSFDPAVDPISDPTIVPPIGLYQPEYGFGKVWRNDSISGGGGDTVRNLLGWAISPPVNYDTVMQARNGQKSLDIYWQLSDGTVAEWIAANAWNRGSVRHDLNAYAHPYGGYTSPEAMPSDNNNSNSVPCPDSGVWPAGCDPNLPPSTDTSTNGVSCPASGVWPPGCDPNLPPSADTSTNDVSCPTSGVWPPGCDPNLPPSN